MTVYRYYTTKLNQYGIMEYPPLPIPDTVGHYGKNGIAFEGICGHFYGFVEYEKELPASDVANFDLVPGPSPSYYPIDEETARRAHEMMSFRDYQKGSKTRQYRVRVDEASMIADRQKKRIDPMYHEKVDRLLASFSRRLAENLNAESRIGTMCPSVLISGGSNFPVRKKQRQNEASERNMKEYQEIMGLISRICSVGTGGISSDEPQAIEKLKLKLEKLEKHQELMKAANAAIRMKDRGKGDAKLKELGYAPDEITELRAPDFCGRVGYPAYELSNNLANIKRIRERIASLEKLKEAPPEGWTFDGGQVVVNTEENRVQLIYDEKPDADTRAKLKENGFRWAPSQKAWQRQLNSAGMYAAREVAPPVEG